MHEDMEVAIISGLEECDQCRDREFPRATHDQIGNIYVKG
jgi:hypothetical protein